MKEGFTFAQLAVILIVVLGLVVTVVLISTQARKAGSGFGSVSESITDSTGTINACVAGGGSCIADCGTDKIAISGINEMGCADDTYCCT